jgi:hypothetical protein
MGVTGWNSPHLPRASPLLPDRPDRPRELDRFVAKQLGPGRETLLDRAGRH